jgi:hypothetical protein
MSKQPAIRTPAAPTQSTARAGARRRTASGWTASISLLLSILAFGSRPAPAQTISRLQLFGGYSYTRFDTRTFGFADKSNLNGWNASAAFNVLTYLGGVAEISGQYGPHVNFRDVAFGPQVLYPRWNLLFFGHGLFGKGRTFDSIGSGLGDTQRAYLFGGGVDMDVPHHDRFAIRVQGDYIRSSLFNADQNNVRVSVGLVYHWHPFRRRHRVPSAP